MKQIAYSAAGLLMVAAAPSCRQQQKLSAELKPQKPNVIVVIADDLGFGDVSFYGSKTINTPNIDSLANGGVRFSNAYASSSTSTPSRYALLTGMYPWREDVKILPGDAPLVIPDTIPTLPAMMRHEGYTTAAIGKWHLGMGNGNVNWNDTIRPGAREIGFDYSCLIAATNDRVPTVYVRDGAVVNLDPDDPIYVDYDKNFPGEPSALDNPEMLRMHWAHGHQNAIVNGIPRIGFMKGGRAARWIDEDMADFFVGEVRHFLQQHKDKPFFLYYGLHQPHVPRVPHQRFAGTSGMGPRGDAIMEADWCVGELMAELRRLDLLENTIVIFTSDNGPVLNDGYRDGAVEMAGSHKPAGGLRGGKYSLFDGGTHVPMCVYWKGHVAAVESDALVTQLDLMASIGEYIGADVPENLDSRAMMPVFLGESTNGRRDIVIENQGKLGLRSGDYVFMPAYSGPKTNLTGNELGNLDSDALFDLRSDPGQQRNIAADKPELTDSLRQVFLERSMGFYRPFVEEVTLK